MTKYSDGTKRELIRMVEKQRRSIGSAAKELGVEKSVAVRWMRIYEFHGYEGLIKKFGSYSGEFKTGAVEYMHRNHLSIHEASAVYGIPSHATLMNWERILCGIHTSTLCAISCLSYSQFNHLPFLILD